MQDTVKMCKLTPNLNPKKYQNQFPLQSDHIITCPYVQIAKKIKKYDLEAK